MNLKWLSIKYYFKSMTLQVFMLDQNPLSLNYHVLLNSYQIIYTTNLSSIRLHVMNGLLL